MLHPIGASSPASPVPRAPASWPPLQLRRARAMQRLAMDLRVLSRELALYLEHQVRVGFFGSGVGLSLILGFSVAYACYYLSSIAKVSQGRGQWSVAGPRDRRCAGATSLALRSGVLLLGPPGLGPACTAAVLREGHPDSVRLFSRDATERSLGLL